MKKTTLLITASVLTMASTAVFAAPGGLVNVNFNPLINYLQKTYTAASTWVYDQTYPNNVTFQHDINVNTATITVNSMPATPTQAANLKAHERTADNLANSLTRFAYALHQQTQSQTTTPNAEKMVAAGEKTASGGPVYFSQYVNDNSIAALTTQPPQNAKVNLGAADTLSFKPTTIAGLVTPADMVYVTPPSVINNGFLDFSSLISPVSYSPSEQANADTFIKYAAHSTQNLTSGVNFSTLERHPQVVADLKTNPLYQHYMFTIRSLLAIRSISLYTLNRLIAERIPVAGLGKAAGLLPSNITPLPSYPTPQQIEAYQKTLVNNQSQIAAYQAATPASPLQVEANQANRRADNPTWYADIRNDSPTTLQRKTLIVLAEIERQNYQAHLDREAILAELAAMNLQLGESSNTQLKLQATNLNEAISKAVSPAPTAAQTAAEKAQATSQANEKNNNAAAATAAAAEKAEQQKEAAQLKAQQQQIQQEKAQQNQKQ